MRRRLGSLLCLFGCAWSALAATPDQLSDQGDWAALLGVHLSTLEAYPQDSAARRGAWRAAMRLGLFEQAAELSSGLAGGLDAREQAAMDGDRIALAIRHGRIDARTLSGPDRYRRLDAALSRSDALAAEFESGRALDGEDQRRLIDRISALVARNRPGAALALYQALVADGVAIPSWAQGELAGAYLAQRQPRPAEVLYRQVLAASPDDFDANLGLFYALLESAQYELAQAHIDGFAARLPVRRHVDGQPNGERWSAQVTADQARVYTDRLAAAQQRIDQRLSETPYNSEARGVQVSLHLARGWPRQGEAELRRTIGSDPRNPGLHADRAETLLALQRWAPARVELDAARELDSDSPRVREAQKTFAQNDRRELYVDSGYGHGQSASPFGSSDWHVDSLLYSSPLAERWRAFAHNYSARADFDGEATSWVRTGVGAEWRSGDWRASGEVNGGQNGSNAKVGVLTALRWQPDDHWKIDAAADSVTNDIPLQAVRAGITAKRAELNIDWRAHESRTLAAAGNVSDFSDGNRRQRVVASWFERWLSGPRWSFETTLGADASRNSLGYAAAYFNPPSDRSAWLSAAAEQLLWRDYDRSWRQRLALTVGNYWQSEFGNGDTEAVEYHQRWELHRDLSLRYGIGRSLRPYDGVREARNFGTLTLLWRF